MTEEEYLELFLSHPVPIYINFDAIRNLNKMEVEEIKCIKVDKDIKLWKELDIRD